MITKLFSMFEEKEGPHPRSFSMTRIIAAAFAVAFIVHWTVPFGWPDAFIAFVILFSIGIFKAIRSAPAQAVIEAVTGMFGKGTPTQIIGGMPFTPQQWAHGDPDEGVL